MTNVHTISLEQEHVRGSFSNEFVPILTIDPGDTVRFSTLDAAWGTEACVDLEMPRRKFRVRQSPADAGHAVVGPIEVLGCGPGDTVSIEILSLRPGTWGWTACGGPRNPLTHLIGQGEEADERLLVWSIDPDRNTATTAI